MPEVALYIPCFNAEKTICACLEAVLKQSYPLKEVVVVDDGSTDATFQIVSRYPVKFIRHEENKGLAAARNTAIKHIDMEFVASLDSDCVPEKDWLKNLMKGFNMADAAGVGGKLVEAFCLEAPDLWRSVHMKQYWDRQDQEPPFLFGSNTVFRRDALVRAGLYSEELKNNYEDVDISKRLKKSGYVLIYEPEAVSRHLRKDTASSLLDRFWDWQLGYYREENFYGSPERFLFKLKENIGLANRYIEEDKAGGREQLLYLDFLLGFHHCLKDFAYFVAGEQGAKTPPSGDCLLSSWLTLIDLVFFYRLDASKESLPTLIPEKNGLLQNFFALNLIAGRLIKETFENESFKKIFYSDLLVSLYGIKDDSLSEYLLRLAGGEAYWDGFLKKSHAGLDMLFLQNLFSHLEEWLHHLKYRLPGLISIIEDSVQREAC